MNEDLFLPGLPAALIAAAYDAAPGNEIAGGKFRNPESSSALVANAFGYFLERPKSLPPLPNCAHRGLPSSVRLEAEVRFPWSGGMHPWLDVLVETDTAIVGIESKRFEPFRTKISSAWSQAYWRDWGTAMSPYERVRDGLRAGDLKFARLDAAQLVKHAFGLRTQIQKISFGKKAMLYYLYAEPPCWPDGRPIDEILHLKHRAELSQFRDAVAGAEVEFCCGTYRELLESWTSETDAQLQAHAAAVGSRFFQR